MLFRSLPSIHVYIISLYQYYVLGVLLNAKVMENKDSISLKDLSHVEEMRIWCERQSTL